MRRSTQRPLPVIARGTIRLIKNEHKVLVRVLPLRITREVNQSMATRSRMDEPRKMTLHRHAPRERAHDLECDPMAPRGLIRGLRTTSTLPVKFPHRLAPKIEDKVKRLPVGITSTGPECLLHAEDGLTIHACATQLLPREL